MNTNIVYDAFESPLGTLRLAAALRGSREHRSSRTRRGMPPIEQRLGARSGVARAAARCGAARASISPAAGASFDLPLAPSGTPFQRAVWDAIATVPPARRFPTPSSRVARDIAGSFRAVGAATGAIRWRSSCRATASSVPTARSPATPADCARKRALLALEGGAHAQLALAV